VGKTHTVGGGAHHEDRPAAGAETPTGGGCAMAREGREGGCTRNRGCARCRAEKSARAGCRAEAEKRARERGAGRRAREREKGRKESGARGKEDIAAARTKRNCGAAAAAGSKDVAWLPAYCPNPQSPYYSPCPRKSAHKSALEPSRPCPSRTINRD